MGFGSVRVAPAGCARSIGQRLIVLLRRWVAPAVHGHPRPVVDVSLTDRRQARAFARVLAAAIDHRLGGLGVALPTPLEILVDHALADDDSLTARLDVLGGPEKPGRYVLHLALTDHGWPQSPDAVIADLNRLLLGTLDHRAAILRVPLAAARSPRPGPSPLTRVWDQLPSEKGALPDGHHDQPEPRRHDA